MVAQANNGVHSGEEQMALITAESDEACLLPPEEIRKRFTGTTAIRIEQKRRHIVDLLAFNMPVDFVAERTQSSSRIVKLIGGQCAQEIAGHAVQFAQVLKAKAAKFLFFAEQKAGEAKFGELMVGVGIAVQRAQEMELATAGHMDDAGSIEMESESPALEKARAFLKSKVQHPAPTVAEAIEA